MDELTENDVGLGDPVPSPVPSPTPTQEVSSGTPTQDNPVEIDTTGESAEAFIGDAEAILATSESAEEGIYDLVEAYKSTKWDNPERALQIVEDYGLKLRQKNPQESNLLRPQEVLDIAPVRPSEVGSDIREWERQNKEVAEKGQDPFFRAYNDTILQDIETAATAAIQQSNDASVSQWQDKLARTGLGILPGVADTLGVTKELERMVRADSNDTLASAVAQGVGSILSIPAIAIDAVTRPLVFGKKAYEKSRAAGGDRLDAAGAATLEAASQALDIITDKFLIGKVKKATTPIAKDILVGAGTEGGTEYVQNLVSEAAAVTGQSQDNFTDMLSPQKTTAAIAGAIVGGGARGIEARFPGAISGYDLAGRRKDITDEQQADTPVTEGVSSVPLEQEIGVTSPGQEALSNPVFPEAAPANTVAVIGEPVSGSPNVTTVEDASTGTPTIQNIDNVVAESNAGEVFIQNPDGTTARVVNGEKKQSHMFTAEVAPDVAKKIADLQAAQPGGVPVAIYHDDLGRPYIQHPLIDNELNVIEEGPANTQPTMLPTVESGGHLLQYSDRRTPFGNVERRATVSNGPVTKTSTVGAQEVKESSVAQKLRERPGLSPELKTILDLDTDFASQLTYVPTSSAETRSDTKELFERFGNNTLDVAEYLLKLDPLEMDVADTYAAATIAPVLDRRANELQTLGTPESIEAAKNYRALAGNLIIRTTNLGSTQGQALRMRQDFPITGVNITAGLEVTEAELIKARVARQYGLTYKQVDAISTEDAKLDAIDRGLADRETVLNNLEQDAITRSDQPEKQIQQVDAEIAAANTVSDTVTNIENQIIDNKSQQRELQAKEKELKLSKKLIVSPENDPEVLAVKEQLAVTEDAKQKRELNTRLKTLVNNIKASNAVEIQQLDAKIDGIKDKLAALSKEATAYREQLIEAKNAAKEASSIRLDELKARRKLLRLEADATYKARKEQLARDREQIQKQREALKTDRKKVQERRDRNERIKAALDKYKNEFDQKLTPELRETINGLVEQIKTQSGHPRELAIKRLGEIVADVKGITVRPGGNPLATFWQSNVLLNVGTQGVNILGNLAHPALSMAKRAVKGDVKASARFGRAWIEALLNFKTLKDVRAGLKGELPSRIDPDFKKENENALKEISKGAFVPREQDAVRALELYFKGVLNRLPGIRDKAAYFLSRPGLSLRALGAMDAVFSRAAQEGYLAAKTPTYSEYLKNKADVYDSLLLQAKGERAQLEKLGVNVPESFEYRRADELYVQSLPEDVRSASTMFARTAVFQSERGPTGFTGGLLKRGLNTIAGIQLNPEKTRAVNAQATLASALRLSNKVARNDVSPEEVFATVIEGIEGGQTLVINGKEFSNSMSTKNILGTVLDAMINKQIIELKGDSIRPLKYMMGMFVNTGSQIIDASMELMPVVGVLDKAKGKWKELSAEEKTDVYAAQVVGTTLAGAILAATVPYMDDEENAYFYIYGGMRDELLRKSYQSKGIRPWSVRVGDNFYYYKDIPGLSLILGAIGELSDATMVAKRTPDRPITTRAAMQALVMGAVYSATQLTMLKNLGVLADALAVTDSQNPRASRLADIIPNVLGPMVVPYTGVARDLERFVYGDLSRPTDLMTRMIQGIPLTKFISETRPALNIFGQPVKTSVTPLLDRLTGGTKHSPGVDWLLRNGYSIALPRAREALTDKQKEKYYQYMQSDNPDTFESFFTDEDQYRYIQLVGPEIEAILLHYADSNPFGFDQAVQKSLTRAINKAKVNAKNQILRGGQ